MRLSQSRSRFKFSPKLTGGVLLSVFLGMYLSAADAFLFKRGFLPLSPILTFVVCLSPYVLFVVLREALSRKPGARVFMQIRKNTLPISVFALLLASGVLSAFHPTANWENYGYWQKQIFYNGLVFGMVLTVSTLSDFEKFARRGILIAFLLLAYSVLNDVFAPGTFSRHSQRAAGFAYNPNTASFYLLILAAALVQFRNNTKVRDLTILGITTIAVLCTLSRSGFLGILVLGSIYAGRLLFDRQSGAKTKLTFILLLATSIALGSLAVTLTLSEGTMFQKKAAQKRVSAILGDGELVQTTDSRFLALDYALDAVNDSPIIGHGNGFSNLLPLMPHNIYLQLWINQGLLGPVLYIMLLASSFYVFRKRRYIPGQAFLALVTLQGFFNHNLVDQRPFLILMALLLQLSGSSNRFPRLSVKPAKAVGADDLNLGGAHAVASVPLTNYR